MKQQLKHASWLKPKEATDHAKQCMERIRQMLRLPDAEPKQREPGQDDEELAA